MLARREPILARVHQRAEEYNFMIKKCSPGTSLALLEEFGHWLCAEIHEHVIFGRNMDPGASPDHMMAFAEPKGFENVVWFRGSAIDWPPDLCSIASHNTDL